MTSDQMLGLIYGALVLVLVGSALAVRRTSGKHMLRMALAWAAIFATGLLLAKILGLRLG